MSEFPSFRLDVHAHYIPARYKAALDRCGLSRAGGFPVPDWTADTTLRFMDGHHIDVQLLSVSDPGVAFLPLGDSVALAKECNDSLAEEVAKHPDRFGGFGVLPLASPEAAEAEAIRALDTLKLDGVSMLSSDDGRYLGDAAWEPLLAALDARGAWVFVHPREIASEQRPSMQLPPALAEYPFDTTRTFISLLINGVFHRHRRIRWHFAHGGGTVAMLSFRLKQLCARAKMVGPMLGLPSASSVLEADSLTEALHRSFFDTAIIADPPSLRAVESMAGVSQMVFGSDWPFAAMIYGAGGDPQPELDSVFQKSDRQRIDSLNALAQFPRFRRS